MTRINITTENLNILRKDTYIDKSSWIPGEWHDEPDNVYWVDSQTGYHCIIKRIDMCGTLRGYVAVEKNHPLYEKSYLSIMDDISVSNSQFCNRYCENGIRHLMDDKDKSWWFELDCYDDLTYGPAYHVYGRNYYSDGKDKIYRNISYVTEQVESLAKQLKERENEY